MKDKQNSIGLDQKQIAHYLKDVKRLRVMTPQRERELSEIMCGDNVTEEQKQEIYQELIDGNLRFVITVAKQYQNQGLDLDDLIAEGNVGLLKAIQNFDWTKKLRFISYAVWWIRQSILQALAEQARIVRLPLNKIGSINKINKAYSELEQKYERPPSAEEMAEFLGCTTEEIKQSLSHNGRHVSMDAPLVEGDESSSSMYDVLANDSMPGPESNLVLESLRKDIERSLTALTPRECDVVKLFYGLEGRAPMSLDEIGVRFDLTRERVRQIKEKAIRRLKHSSKNRILKSYLG